MTKPACVFCARVRDGEFERESGFAVSFPPRNPVTPGHLLVIPRVHLRDAAQSPSHAADAFVMAACLAGEVGDCNLITSIGPDATQTVFHMHIHVVPRRKNDGLALPWTGQKRDGAR